MHLHKITSGILLLFLVVISGRISAQDSDLIRTKKNFIQLLGNTGQEQLNAVLEKLPREESASDQMVVELFQRQSSQAASIQNIYTNRQKTAPGQTLTIRTKNVRDGNRASTPNAFWN